MRTKTAISSGELNSVQRLIDSYHSLRSSEYQVVTQVAELLGCTIDQAWDVVQRYDTAHNVLMKSAIEIYDDDVEPETIPIREQFGIDRETWWMWSFMAGGFALVLLAVYAACG